MSQSSFWKNKRVLVTGHTGFKGAWLSLWLHELGAKLCGYALKPHTQPALYEVLKLREFFGSDEFMDLRDEKKVFESFRKFEPEIVFHLAAQPLVRASYEVPLETFDVNVMGTAHVLDAIRKTPSVRVAVMITTDKVYENQEWDRPYREDDRLGGFDPYSSSKACSELVIESYRRAFIGDRVGVAAARAGNVIGGGDWAGDRLVPDVVRALTAKKSLTLRNPHSLRPWQHVLEPLSGYMNLAERLWNDQAAFSGGWNFGPEISDTVSVENLIKYFFKSWGQETKIECIPSALHEANILKLDITKAKTELKWTPRYSIQEALQITADWYRQYYSLSSDMRAFSLKQIEDFSNF